ncbi:histidinol dehydrogenase [Terrimonas sp.]|uniref:histidinol dehydrogenase n=1 Tax=Terrimonas sp. TaxID=1914338 RepID=UPI000D524F4A|nr:histidinol dehydrogenase [Terrimonas sp.]PVD50820.1 histidinol dehydrogenase [Terrimonas sp.]
MKVIINPERKDWNALVKRPSLDTSSLENSVMEVLNAVRQKGDEALKAFTKKFDGAEIEDFRVSENEITEAGASLSAEIKNAVLQAKENIFRFHIAQKASAEKIETMPGITCWRKSVGIEKVGLYIPGGSAPLFSTVLMLGIPASIAGCKEIILCTPPGKNGTINPAILFAAQVAGITKIFKVGGAQAIAALAYGTATIPSVYKIFGPGNQYVTCAKQMIEREGIAIDMPAGPSEVCVLADETADAGFIAADLLSQAEHGPDSQVLLVSTSESLAEKVNLEIEKQLELLPRKDIAVAALYNSKAIIVKHMEEAISLINEYAPEHLIISCKNDESISEQIINAGSVFLGNYSPESVGDYASGTNHTLPTNAFAKAYSGVSVDSFVKKITFQKLSQQGLERIGDTVITMAEAEGLQAHANAVKIRLQK